MEYCATGKAFFQRIISDVGSVNDLLNKNKIHIVFVELGNFIKHHITIIYIYILM